MKRKHLAIIVALALTACAAILYAARGVGKWGRSTAPRGFVATQGSRFIVDGRPFRFVGANVALMYGEDERARMPELLRAAAQSGVSVVRVWAFGEVDERSASPKERAEKDWLYANPFRRAPDDWNEAAFAHLDRVLSEAARNNLRVQICLVNWWPDTGGVTQYLKWAGVTDAYDTNHPHHVNAERAMLFYTDEAARRLYRQHVERIVARRNTVSGKFYRDDPTILGYELMNEAQAPTGRAAERRAWVEEMSAYVKSLDPHHLVTPGLWGYRNARERREWLEAHRAPTVDYCDVHLYPRDDADVYVRSPEDLREFVENRAAAAFSLAKPLVFGEFGISSEGFNHLSQDEWFRAYFESAARTGAGGAMFWILTHVETRQYGVSYDATRDAGVRAELRRAAQLFDATAQADPPPRVQDAGRHLIPHQFAFARAAGEMSAALPQLEILKDGSLLYRFTPEQSARGRFEKLGSGSGYVWGDGVGFFEYVIPERGEWREVGELVVRAHLQPTPPGDARGRVNSTRVTLFINGTDCGARLVPVEQKSRAHVEEWRVRSLSARMQAMRGQSLSIRFAVEVEADQPFGLTIANFPEGFDARGAAPVEVELR